MRYVKPAFNKAAHNRLQRGQRGQNAILDRGLSAIIAALAILGVLAAYFLFSGNSNAQNEESQISAISAEVENLYGTQSNFVGLTSAVIAGTGALSPTWVVNTGTAAAPAYAIVSIYKSPITITPQTNPTTGLVAGAFEISVTDLPNSACSTIATTNVGANEIGLVINAVTAPAAIASGASPLPTPAVAEAACTKGANTVNIWLD